MKERRCTILVDPEGSSTGALGSALAGSPYALAAAIRSVDEALDLVRGGLKPEMLLVTVPDEKPDSHAEALRQLRSATPGARLVVLGDAFAEPLLSVALRVGAEGCLDRQIRPSALQRALALVTLGMTVMPDAVSGVLDSGSEPSGQVDGAEGGELSRREIEILRCLLAGQSNKAIARELDITESTVKMHFKNLMRKIRAQNRTQAAVWAIQRGLAGSHAVAPALRPRAVP